MNIYIAKDDSTIENFTTIKIQDFQTEMQKLVNNCCDNIVADDIVDFLNPDSINTFIGALASKLRTGGNLAITGVELGVFCRHAVDEVISSEDFSKVINSRSSISSVNDITDILKKYKLIVNSASIKGIKYDVSATR